MDTVLSLEQQISDAFENCPHFSGRQLRYEAHDGHVTLRGRVGSYFQKQMAQETVRKINGVHRIDNELVVAPPAAS